jgi:hypothetical protein
MQDFYRLVGGYEEKANQMQEMVCKKLVLDIQGASSVCHKLLRFKIRKEYVQSRSKNL